MYVHVKQYSPPQDLWLFLKMSTGYFWKFEGKKPLDHQHILNFTGKFSFAVVRPSAFSTLKRLVLHNYTFLV